MLPDQEKRDRRSPNLAPQEAHSHSPAFALVADYQHLEGESHVIALDRFN